MTERTEKLLAECKKAGYEAVTVLVRDERVPRSMTIKHGFWFGDQPNYGDSPNDPIRVICGHPERIAQDGQPEMWKIIRKSGLTAGLFMGEGRGMGDCHEIQMSLAGSLTPGCYELKG